MGVPIRSIKSFEEDIKYRSRKDWTLILIANANSDSRAVEFIHNNFHVMDTISDDVDFYLPGYNAPTGNIFDERYHEPYMREQWYMDMEEREFADSHMNNLHSERIYSHRIGRISFHEAEFVDFVMEFTQKKRGYVYWGTCQMILIPITRERTPDYSGAQIFDLDKIIATPSGPSLDTFFYRSFQIIREDRHYSFFERTFMGKHNYLINKINELYNEATFSRSHEDRYEIIIRNVVLDMERCLNWRLSEEFYFISYSSRNVMKATMLRNILQNRGLNVWIAPDGIPQGREYSLVIPTALRFAKYFVLLLTKESANSRWVKRELDIAISNEANTRVKVLLADNYTVEDIRNDHELMFYLNKVQVKYEFDNVVTNQSKLEQFIRE